VHQRYRVGDDGGVGGGQHSVTQVEHVTRGPRVDGTATYSSLGRPIAVLSDVKIEYRPGPPPKATKKKGFGTRD